jgi:superoxide dismutase, Fe-Mn family
MTDNSIDRRTVLQGATTALAAGAATAAAAAPRHTLPKLPYALDALEPYIDARTMELHHDKHHQTYVDNLNKALAGNDALAKLSVEDLLAHLENVPESIRTAVRNHGGGHANHSLFWLNLAPAKGQAPKGELAAAIEKTFGGQSALVDKLKSTALGVFGSGWAWLSSDASGKLAVGGSSNQDTPLSRGETPLVAIDVWEHAYYLKYQNRRAEYLEAIPHIINWDWVSERYAGLVKRG